MATNWKLISTISNAVRVHKVTGAPLPEHGWWDKSINDDDLAGLLKNILSRDGGLSVAIDILHMRFFGSRNESHKYSENMIEVGRNVLSMYQFSERYGKSRGYDYELAQIANVCLKGEGGVVTAKIICNTAAGISTNILASPF